ncbi:hypothetical protein, conserved [Trypanosoma brucei gambiense DAL972]|uniref:Uncharacterized protein n=1 Tax=Trypanosoma brucei gambiense (strain MHOM/CI/86/DAL972) TaxID=679716 RepID=C9ZHU2_TRYB9|nr:hypothetical protein, conserved [Trypanosoma brucei gambiense DAL972]CBH08813.1 hypothetical protein, conserved [Trypanosoma brucei gambiense DAL972]|eukprot:XP_011771254.1 hypothetical protein, conserved [Trypanosoma brucei gambiense DAL972]
MCDPLVERFISDIIRDPQAWQRAVTSPDNRCCLLPTSNVIRSLAGPLFRRGCVDNVSSLRFLTTLRRDTLSGGNVQRVSMKRKDLRGPWDHRTRVSEEDQPNILIQLLVRQLERNGFGTSYRKAVYSLLGKQVKEMSKKKRQHDAAATAKTMKLNARRIEHLLMEEYNERKKTCDREGRRRQALVRGFFNKASVVVENEEFIGRRTIFQDALDECFAIKTLMEGETQKLTGIPPEHQRNYFAIQQKEKHERECLLARFETQRRAIYLQLQHDIKNSIKSEIRRIMRREKHIEELYKKHGCGK